MEQDEKKITISDAIYTEIEKRSKVAGFQGVSEYIEYVLQQLIDKAKQKQDVKPCTQEEKAVAEELRKAGYLE